MVVHLVAFRFRDGVAPEHVRRLEERLAALPGLIPEIRDYRFGPDLGLREGNADFGVVATFDDEAGFTAYLDHPAHRSVLDEALKPILDLRLAAQIQS